MKNIADKLKNNIKLAVKGKDDIIELVIISLICGGHILLDDIPGTGKTTLAKAIAKSVNCEFKRIQCTPDLLPSDITGINFYNQKENCFIFKKGAAFTNILLADEINRAAPRTQSSLLECMEENQISVDGVTMPLPQPFMVIATENPIEIHGTFPLPEAQLDRFFMCIKMGYPDAAYEKDILNAHCGINKTDALKSIINSEELLNARKFIHNVKAVDCVMDYIIDFVTATRSNDKIKLGISPRGTIALLTAARGYAAINEREFITPDDVKIMAPFICAHRIIPKNTISLSMDERRKLICEIISAVPVPKE